MSSSADRRGFTLLEVMVALTLVGGLVAAGLGVAAADARASRRAVALHEASALAEELLARASLASGAQLAGWARGVEGSFPPPMEHYGWRLSTTRAGGEGELVEVAATVWWGEGSLPVSTRVVPRPVGAPEAGR